MRKLCIAIVVFCSTYFFCTTDNPTQETVKGDYTDSMVIDLYAYSMWCFQHNSSYFGPLTITTKGQNLLKEPLDPNLKVYNSGSMIYPIFTPKFPPSKFEAFVYDSIPLVDGDSLNPELLVKSFSNSRTYMFSRDTSSSKDSIENIEKCISQPEISYIYGYGFLLDYKNWGIGKIKIYYK